MPQFSQPESTEFPAAGWRPKVCSKHPISSSATYIPYTVRLAPNNVAVLIYDCPGTAPDTYQITYFQDSVAVVQWVSDDCGTITEP